VPLIWDEEPLLRSRDFGDVVLTGGAPREPGDRAAGDGWRPAARAVEQGAFEQNTLHIKGRVVGHGGNRQGIAGALVWLPGSLDCHARTGSDGGFRLALPGGLGSRLAAGKAGFSTAVAQVPSGNLQAELVFELEPAPAVVAGAVVDARGRPVAGARVKVARPQAVAPPVTHADAAGGFRLEGLPEGNHHLEVSAVGFASSRSVAEAKTAVPSEGSVRVVLHRPRVLTGRVVDKVERALAGVQVLVERERADDAVLEARTGEDGRFVLDLLGSGPHVVTFEEPGYARVTRHVQVEEGEGRQEMETTMLPEGGRVSGCVSGTAGRPLDGVEVYLQRLPKSRRMAASGRPAWPRETETGADGCFTLERLAIGQRHELELWRAGYSPTHHSLVLAEPELDFKISMQPAVAVTVKVVAENGAPIPGANVALHYDVTAALRQGSKPHARTGDDGTFVFEAVSPGPARLEVLPDPSYAAHEEELVVAADEESRTVTVVLQEAAVLCGTITDGAGSPVAGVEVEAPSPLGRSIGSLLGLRLGGTDARGEFCLEWLPPGPNTIVMTHRDFHPERQVVTLLAGEQHHRFQLRRRERFEVSGTLLVEEGETAAGHGVSLYHEGDVVGTTTDAGGSFTFSDLAEGDYRLALAGDLTVSPAASDLRVDRNLHGLTFQARRGCSIEGILVRNSDEHRQVAVVATAGSAMRQGFVDSDGGAFSFMKLYPGSWRVEAQVANSGPKASAIVECPAGGKVVDVRLALD
jgi:Carboxypeptidase regulatory-like domain